MKLLTLNFLTCARKDCKGRSLAFPLHPRDAELETVEMELNVEFLRNILPRLEWDAVKLIAHELGIVNLPSILPELADLVSTPIESIDETSIAKPTSLCRDLHRILMETSIKEGKLVCYACGHEYAVKEGIANFLLPAHLV